MSIRYPGDIGADLDCCLIPDMNEYPHVAAVVLNWNRRDETLACLESLARSDWPRLTTIVVDNGSHEDIQAAIAGRFTEAVVVLNPTNRGFAGGMNVGVRRALDLNADYVLLLNNDAAVDKAMIRILVDAASGRPDAGMICPLHLYRDSPEIISSAGLRCDLRRGYQAPPLGVGQRDLGQFHGVAEVEAPSGTAMLAPADVVREVGLLDEDLFLYIEDMDWAFRMRKAGRHIYVAYGARVWHGLGTSSGGKDSPAVNYYHTRNSFVVTARHAPLRGLRGFVRHSEILAANLLHAFRSKQPVANTRAVLVGWRDYLRGRLGPHPDFLPVAPRRAISGIGCEEEIVTD